MKFDKYLVDFAKGYYSTVYVDKVTEESITAVGGYIGDQIRIWKTSWSYEAENVIKSNKELNTLIMEDIEDWLWEHKTAYEDCQRHFKTGYITTIYLMDFENWIEEHEQLAEDYRDYFSGGWRK